jgi:hypothetical protein
LAVPLELSGVRDPATAESTQTENICSLGARVITRRPRKPNEHLRVASSVGRLKMNARVVYCQPLREGEFAVGLHFEKLASHFVEAACGASGAD